MSATELDVPVLFSSDQIRRREFVTIRRGYDPHQVRDYLDQLDGHADPSLDEIGYPPGLGGGQPGGARLAATISCRSGSSGSASNNAAA